MRAPPLGQLRNILSCYGRGVRRCLVGVFVLAGCSTDKYEPPPPEAVASCKLTEKQQGKVTEQQALWFDSSNRLVQADGYDSSTTYEYDDQGRLQRSSNPTQTTTWTYEPTQITADSSGVGVFVLTLDADGRALHDEGPGTKSDYQHDANGRITSFSGQRGRTMPDSRSFQYTYDDQGRIASAASGSMPPTTYTYTETPGHLAIALGGTKIFDADYAFDFDSEGRVVSAGAGRDGTQPYTYDGDTITMVTNVGYEVDATGACAGPAATFGPSDPLPIRPFANVVTFMNPPAEDFAQTYD